MKHAPVAGCCAPGGHRLRETASRVLLGLLHRGVGYAYGGSALDHPKNENSFACMIHSLWLCDPLQKTSSARRTTGFPRSWGNAAIFARVSDQQLVIAGIITAGLPPQRRRTGGGEASVRQARPPVHRRWTGLSKACATPGIHLAKRTCGIFIKEMILHLSARYISQRALRIHRGIHLYCQDVNFDVVPVGHIALITVWGQRYFVTSGGPGSSCQTLSCHMNNVITLSRNTTKTISDFLVQISIGIDLCTVGNMRCVVFPWSKDH